MRIPPNFIDGIQKDPQRCLLLVGAGMSRKVRVGGKSFPDWPALMGRMIVELQQRRFDANMLERLRSDLTRGNYLAIAQEFKARTRPDEFSNFLRKELDPPDLIKSSLHELILAIQFRGIITTNFDCVIEFHTNRFRPMVYPQFLEEPARFRSVPFLAKIHGCIRTPNPSENLVLTKDSYTKLRRDQRYQNLLRTWILGYTILTVGFSLRDPDFRGVIEDVRTVYGDDVPTTYALIRQPTTEQRAHWKRRGVVILPYDEHRDLRPFFKELYELSEQKYPNPTSRLSAAPSLFTKVSQVKPQAWAFYSKWREEGSQSPLFGKVDITLKGWRHVVRVSRSQAEVCHKLSLLRCAKELVEKATQSVKLRDLDRRVGSSWSEALKNAVGVTPQRIRSTDHLGRPVERELHVIHGRSLPPFRPPIEIEVVLLVARPQQDTRSILSTTFYSVYELR